MPRSKRPKRRSARSGPQASRAALAYDPTKTSKLHLAQILREATSAAREAAPPIAQLPEPPSEEPRLAEAPIQVRLSPLDVFLLGSIGVDDSIDESQGEGT